MESDRQRQLTILLITAIVIIIIVAVIALVAIWYPKSVSNTDENDNYAEVGKVEIITMETEDICKKYFSELAALIANCDYDTLYSELSEDYIDYTGMTKLSLKDKLENEAVAGKMLNLYEYTSGNVSNYAAVYGLNLKVANSVYDEKVVVRETSPSDYSFAFDDFVQRKVNCYNSTTNSLNVNVDSILYLTDKVQINLTVKNVYKGNIMLNGKNLTEGVYLKLSDNSLVSPYVVAFGGKSIKLLPGQSKKIELTYEVDNLQLKSLNTLVFKDVFYTGKNSYSDVEINIFN